MLANETTARVKCLALLILFSASTGSAASAQTPEPSLETVLTPGITVWITDSGGREEKARIVGVEGGIVTTAAENDMRRLRTADVMRVRVRQSDSVIDGALIGAAGAVVPALLLCRLTEPWENCRDDVGPMLRLGAIGAAAGIGIDALIRGRKTIYQAAPPSTRLYAAPIVTRHARGLQVTLSF